MAAATKSQQDRYYDTLLGQGASPEDAYEEAYGAKMPRAQKSSAAPTTGGSAGRSGANPDAALKIEQEKTRRAQIEQQTKQQAARAATTQAIIRNVGGSGALSGAVDAATMLGVSVATVIWNESRVGANRTQWEFGELLLGFVMAGAARPGAVRDSALAVMEAGFLSLFFLH